MANECDADEDYTWLYTPYLWSNYPNNINTASPTDSDFVVTLAIPKPNIAPQNRTGERNVLPLGTIGQGPVQSSCGHTGANTGRLPTGSTGPSLVPARPARPVPKGRQVVESARPVQPIPSSQWF